MGWSSNNKPPLEIRVPCSALLKGNQWLTSPKTIFLGAQISFFKGTHVGMDANLMQMWGWCYWEWIFCSILFLYALWVGICFGYMHNVYIYMYICIYLFIYLLIFIYIYIHVKYAITYLMIDMIFSMDHSMEPLRCEFALPGLSCHRLCRCQIHNISRCQVSSQPDISNIMKVYDQGLIGWFP